MPVETQGFIYTCTYILRNPFQTKKKCCTCRSHERSMLTLCGRRNKCLRFPTKGLFSDPLSGFKLIASVQSLELTSSESWTKQLASSSLDVEDNTIWFIPVPELDTSKTSGTCLGFFADCSTNCEDGIISFTL
uniref:Uncharacterized protein n=1 Tax=Spongospora subterranea TaxID=70186 RepID=A0A0H5QXY0_9EUKA|eukprot:CRZ06825.1 hypothetical protein [Spongospora subterranea]